MVRPKYLSLTVVLMCITNATGWLTVEWNKPHARTRMVVFTLLILIGYVFLWSYWKGKNWARIAVLLTSALTIYNLRYWHQGNIASTLTIASEAWIGMFLLYWLNTAQVREFFKSGNSSQDSTASA
jgi:hypothetical protein